MIKWMNIELRLIELERELEHGGGGAAPPPPSGRVPPGEMSPPPHDADAMTAAATEALAARFGSGAWPQMPVGVLQQVRARLRCAKKWTNLMREWADDPRLQWQPPALHSWESAHLLLVEMGPFLDDLRE